MQSATIFVLLCVLAAVAAHTHYESYRGPSADAVQAEYFESVYESPAHERSPRTKRGLLLLKKKLLLGALGLKAAKVGVVGAGVAGALALKKKHQGPEWNVEVHRCFGKFTM